MDEGAGPRRSGERQLDQIERLARETGRVMGRTARRMETTSRQVFEVVSREARSGAKEAVRRTSIVVDEARNEIPRLRAELREMEARVRERIK